MRYSEGGVEHENQRGQFSEMVPANCLLCCHHRKHPLSVAFPVHLIRIIIQQ